MGNKHYAPHHKSAKNVEWSSETWSMYFADPVATLSCFSRLPLLQLNSDHLKSLSFYNIYLFPGFLVTMRSLIKRVSCIWLKHNKVMYATRE